MNIIPTHNKNIKKVKFLLKYIVASLSLDVVHFILMKDTLIKTSFRLLKTLNIMI